MDVDASSIPEERRCYIRHDRPGFIGYSITPGTLQRRCIKQIGNPKPQIFEIPHDNLLCSTLQNAVETLE